MQFSFILLLKNFRVLNTLHLEISNSLAWGGFGNFLEPHKFCVPIVNLSGLTRGWFILKTFYDFSFTGWLVWLRNWNWYINIFSSVAGIPLSASILTTGIVCTFYTSLVSIWQRKLPITSQKLSPVRMSYRADFFWLGRVKPIKYSSDRISKIYRGKHFLFLGVNSLNQGILLPE